MNNDKISQKQGISMIAMFLIGTSSLFVMGLEAKMDIWIAILLAGGVGALVMLIYARLMSVLPDKDFFETLEFFLGKAGSKIVILIFTLFSFDTCGGVVRNFGQFVSTAGLPDTPFLASIIMLIVLSIFAVRSGVEVLGRWAETSVIFIISFLFISILLVSKNMNISNILPVLDNGIQPIAKGALGVLSFPFLNTVVFLMVFPAFKKGISAKKVFLKGLLVGGIAILVLSLTDILVLGTSIAENMYYPTYTAMATVHYGNFLQRFEVIAAIVFIITAFFKTAIVLFATCKGTSRLFGFKDYRFLVIPIAFLIVNYTISSFDSMIYYEEWSIKVWPYYSQIFQIIIPLILLIIIEIKLKKNKKALGIAP